jgi:hypothetical protein
MSEFGSGFIVCLLQFVYHEPRLYEWARMMPDGVCLWADGAKDHLYGLKKPPRVSTSDWKEACHIRDMVSAWAWTWNNRSMLTTTMATELLDEAKGIIVAYGGRDLLKGDPGLEGAMVLDRKLGLKRIDTGDAATCTQPIKVH